MLDLYDASFKSTATKANYKQALSKFQRDLEISNLETVKPKELQKILIEYVLKLREKKRSRAVQNMLVSAVQKFCDVYDIEDVNWRKVRGYMAEDESEPTDRFYTNEELQKLIDNASVRMKAIILFMASTGCRVGALPELKYRHFIKLDNGLAKVIIYASSKKDKYTGFLTPEAVHAVDSYIEWRKTRGEDITPDSPLFRDAFSEPSANNVHHITRNAVSLDMTDLAVQTGLRKVTDGSHKDVMLTHNFRKRFNTCLMKAGCKPIIVEKLMGHKSGIQESYLRMSDDDLMVDFLKAAEGLTVSEEKHLKHEVAKLKAENADIDTLKKMHLDTKLEMARMAEDHKKEMAAVMEAIRANPSLSHVKPEVLTKKLRG